jgi:hypothetical protein
MLFEHPYVSAALIVIILLYFFIIIKIYNDQNK